MKDRIKAILKDRILTRQEIASELKADLDDVDSAASEMLDDGELHICCITSEGFKLSLNANRD